MKNLKRIRFMQASEDGVTYYSPTGNKISKATLKADGTIKKDIIATPFSTFPSYFINVKVLDDPITIVLFFVFNLPLLLLSGYLKSMWLFYTALFFTLFVSYRLFKLLFIIYHMKVSKCLYKTSKFMAASHMVTNAYKKLQRIPTLEEAKKFSRFSTAHTVALDLGSVFCRIVQFIGICFVPYFDGFKEWFLILILPIVIILISTTGIFNFFQILVTSKPSDEELKVAIEGVKCYEFMEENMEVVVTAE